MKALIIGSILRHVLTGAGSVIIAKGYSDASAWEAISGGVLALVGLVASYFNKKRLS